MSRANQAAVDLMAADALAPLTDLAALQPWLMSFESVTGFSQ
jgi:hypothetical protein